MHPSSINANSDVLLDPLNRFFKVLKKNAVFLWIVLGTLVGLFLVYAIHSAVQSKRSETVMQEWYALKKGLQPPYDKLAEEKKQALKAFVEKHQHQRSVLEAAVVWAEVSYEQQNLDQAEQALKIALSVSSQTLLKNNLQFFLASVLESEKKYSEALEVLKKQESKAPMDFKPMILLSMARNAMLSQDPVLAIRYYDQFLKDFPNHVDVKKVEALKKTISVSQ